MSRYVLLEAELEGAIPILPEAVLEPPALPAADGSDAAAAGASGSGGATGGLVGSLGTLWDLDAYVLTLHCYTGMVAVRPSDVGVSVRTGVRPASSRVDPGGLKTLVGQRRIITRRTRPVGGAEPSMRQELASKLAAVAAEHSRGAPSLGAASSDGLADRLAQLAHANRAQPQIASAMLGSRNGTLAPLGGLLGGVSAAQASPSDWLDLLWRTHRRALLPTDAVLARASLGLTRLREASAAAHAAHAADSEPPASLLAARMLHDRESLAAASAAVASLVAEANATRDSGPAAASGATASALDASVRMLVSVPSDVEIDGTGDSASPMRLVETIEQLASQAQSPGGPPRRVLFASPSDLPAMPLVIASAWARGLPAFSLSMLLQTHVPPFPWQQALAHSLKPSDAGDAAGRAANGCGACTSTGAGSCGCSGRERWINQAAELAMQVVAERLFGSSGSADFHDVALMRCDARRSLADRPSDLGTSSGRARRAAWSTLQSATSVAQLRRTFHLSLLIGAHEREQQQQQQQAPTLTPTPAQAPPSFSYTSRAMLRCPASAFELVPQGSTATSTSLGTKASAAAGGALASPQATAGVHASTITTAAANGHAGKPPSKHTVKSKAAGKAKAPKNK